MDKKQLLELALADDGGPVVNVLVKALELQNSTLAEALMRQSAEFMIRMEAMATKAIDTVQQNSADMRAAYVALLSQQSAVPRATFRNGRPVRSVGASPPVHRESSPGAATGGPADFQGAPEEDADNRVVEISTEEVLSSIDPLNLGRMNSGWMPPR